MTRWRNNYFTWMSLLPHTLISDCCGALDDRWVPWWLPMPICQALCCALLEQSVFMDEYVHRNQYWLCEACQTWHKNPSTHQSGASKQPLFGKTFHFNFPVTGSRGFQWERNQGKLQGISMSETRETARIKLNVCCPMSCHYHYQLAHSSVLSVSILPIQLNTNCTDNWQQQCRWVLLHGRWISCYQLLECPFKCKNIVLQF